MGIAIRLFGQFTLESGGKVTRLDVLLGKQLQELLELLVIHRTEPLSKEQFFDMLYSENSDPRASLKYNIFRLRSLLKNLPELSDCELIQNYAGSYRLNPDAPILSDVEMFDRTWNKVKYLGRAEALPSVRFILRIYKGYLYQTASQPIWSTQIREYYHRIYLRIATNCADFLHENGEYDREISLCHHVLSIDRFCEAINYDYLRALSAVNEYATAIQHYNTYNTLCLNLYGELPSLRIRTLYSELSANSDEMLNADNMQQLLLAGKQLTGAFFCNYDIFRYIYQIELRKTIRSEQLRFLLLIEILNIADRAVLNGWMNRMRDTLMVNLRSCDVFTRVNQRQFIVLVTCRKRENAEMLSERILKAFFNSAVYRVVHVNTSVREILPPDVSINSGNNQVSEIQE